MYIVRFTEQLVNTKYIVLVIRNHWYKLTSYDPMIINHKTCLLTTLWIQLISQKYVAGMDQNQTEENSIGKIGFLQSVQTCYIDGHIKKQYIYLSRGRSWEETATSAGKISVPWCNKCPKLSLLLTNGSLA